MARKKQHIAKGGPILKLTSTEATLRSMPHYNGYACGHGVLGDTKFNRAKEKARYARAMECGE